jgi:hypothetical protein
MKAEEMHRHAQATGQVHLHFLPPSGLKTAFDGSGKE